MRRSWMLAAVLAFGGLAGCQCAQLPSDVLFRCEPDNTCPQGAYCGGDGYCHVVAVSDSGFPCNAPEDAGFLFQASVCSTSGWCWEHPLPVGAELNDVRGTSKGEVYFAGSGGLLMKFDGTTFTGVKTPATVTQELRSLWGRGDETLYALAAGGTVLYYPGDTEATVFTQFIGENCVSLSGWEDVLLWAGSENAGIFELNLVTPQWRRGWSGGGGGIWMQTLLPRSAKEIWAAGDVSVVAVRSEVSPGTWTNGGGITFQDAGRPDLYGLAALGPDDMLVGGEQGFLGRVHVTRLGDGGYQLEPTEERTRNLTAPTIRDFWTGPGGTIWAVGTSGYTAQRATDGTWAEDSIPDAGSLLAAWGTDDAEPWAVGSRGALKRRACDAWQDVDYHASTRRLNGVFHNGTTAWAVGDFGTVMRQTGGRWELTAANRFPVTSALYDVWAASDSDVIVAGQDGILATFDGTTWKSVSGLTNPPTWNRIFARDANDVWVVGNSESYIRRVNGVWGPVESVNTGFGNIGGVAFGAAGEAWLSGDGNVRVQHTTDDGMTWQTEDNGLPSSWLGSIVRTEDGALWVSGGFPELYRLAPGTQTWTPVQLGTGNFRQPWSACALPGNRVAFAGQDGLLGVATDLGGEIHVSYSGRNFEDISCDPVTGALAAGDNAQLLRLAP